MLGGIRRMLSARETVSETPAPTPEQFIAAEPGHPMAALERAMPEACRTIDEATEEILALLAGRDLSELARHNHALVGYDWYGYLSASRHRIRQLVKLLRDCGVERGRVIDSGSYFGNFALALRRLGYEVYACDSYADARGALDPWVGLLRRAGVEIVELGDFDRGLGLPDGCANAVVSGGVIEHIPHSPKAYLLELRRVARPGGVVTIETPNLGYQYKRDLLAEGKSPWPPIASQFDSEPPFAGHHREYTADEIEWMLRRVGLDPIETRFMDYSYLTLPFVDERTATAYRQRARDSSRQELIMTAARR